MLCYFTINGKNYATQVDFHEKDADSKATWQVYEVKEAGVDDARKVERRTVDLVEELDQLVLKAYHEYAKTNPAFPQCATLEEIAKRPPHRQTLVQTALLGNTIHEIYPQSGYQFLIDCYSDWSKGILQWKAN